MADSPKKMEVLSTLKSDTAIYFIFGGLTKAIPFLAGLLLAKWMSPADFGMAGVFISLVAVLASLANFSVSQQVVRESELLGRQEFLCLVGTSRYFSLGILFLALFFLLIFFDEVSEFLSLDFWVLLAALVLAFFRATCDLVDKLLVLEKRSKDLGVVQSFGSAVTAIASVILVYSVHQDNSLPARITGIFLGTMAWFSLGLYFFKRYGYSFRFVSYPAFINILSYGVRVAPQLVSNWVKMGGDRIVLVSVLAPDSMGAYVFLMMLVSVFPVFGTAINNVFLPESMRMYRESNVFALRHIRFKYVLFLFFASLLGSVSLIGLNLLGFWPGGYEITYLAVLAIMCALFFQYVYMLYMKVFLYCDWMSKLGWVNMACAIGYVLLIYLTPVDMTLELACLFLLLYNAVMAIYVVVVARAYEAELSKQRMMSECDIEKNNC